MNALCAYLTFNGNCREAMSFYRDCLGGELHFQFVGDPVEDELPKEIENLVLQASLIGPGFRLYATDLAGEQHLQTGNTISLFLDTDDRDELYLIFNKLALGGEHIQPPMKNAWGSIVGELKDQFGHQWIVHFSKPIN